VLDESFARDGTYQLVVPPRFGAVPTAIKRLCYMNYVSKSQGDSAEKGMHATERLFHRRDLLKREP
jgi:hypothetical protein